MIKPKQDELWLAYLEMLAIEGALKNGEGFVLVRDMLQLVLAHLRSKDDFEKYMAEAIVSIENTFATLLSLFPNEGRAEVVEQHVKTIHVITTLLDRKRKEM
jgi:hypothetical protein